VPKKQPQTKAKTTPQFDADPGDDDEEMPFTLDDEGNMVLRRSESQPKAKAPKRTGGKRGRRRDH